MAKLREPASTGDYLANRIEEYVFHQDIRRWLGASPLPENVVAALDLTDAQMQWADALLERLSREHPGRQHQADWSPQIVAEFGPMAPRAEFEQSRYRNRGGSVEGANAT